ncbi:hypothetical protein [Erythrobacter sp. F6033]|uniref:hypothetical protein n=1 Tax=Erythrobacter sp. F6033 TaxID=2926401 RepID=UPI001FF11377|nr:hypothetical protein [Erythrobacter sp. F6033]MCK0128043.1 hypothetical protein [Erythrobacter sp. F6033]
MSIRFAALNSQARFPACTPIDRTVVRRAIEQAANDNSNSVPNDQVLRAALRHFAEHGLGAARSARAHAEQAFFAGDRHAYDWWMSITRTLDRRLAATAEAGINAKNVT